MADYVQIPEDGVGKKVRHVEATIGPDTVHVPSVIITDQTDPTKSAPVDSTYGVKADVSRSALPTGAATSAKQDTEIASLASIDGKVPALGQALAAASVPVILPAATITTLTPPAAITGFATSAKQDTAQTSLSSIDAKLTTIDGRVDGVETSLASLDAKAPALGQALAAASVPVVLTAAQLSTLTPPAAISGFATAANQATEISGLASIDGHVDGIEGLLTTIDADTGALAAVDFATGSDVASLAVVGSGTQATAQRVTIASDATVPLPTGAATSAKQDTAQTSLSSIDTKLTTIDGRVDGVEASLVSLDAKSPSLGQALAAASVPVVLPSAQVSALTPPAAITGFATEAKQDTIIGHLDGVETLLGTIDADTGALAAVDFATGADVASLAVVGSGTQAAAQRVTIASDATVPLPTGAATSAKQDTAQVSLSSIDTKLTTIDGRVDGVEASLSSLDAKSPALGQALAAASVPVVLTAAQVSALTPPAAITGFATEAKQDTIIGHVDGIEGLLSTIDADTGTLAAVDFATGSDVASLAVVGSGTQATAQRVTIASDATVPLPTGAATSAKQDTMIGHLDGVEKLLAVGVRMLPVPGLTQSTSVYQSGLCMTNTGHLYLVMGSGGIYRKGYGESQFTDLAQTTRGYFGCCADADGNIYATHQGGDIYKQTGGTGDFVAMSQTTRSWTGIAASVHANVSAAGAFVCAAVYGGDIYRRTANTGDFVAIGGTSRNWTGVAIDYSTNDVYACVYGGDVYKQTGGSGAFNAMGVGTKNWYGISVSGGVMYLAEYNGRIWKYEDGYLRRMTAFKYRGWTSVIIGNQWSYGEAFIGNDTIYASTGDGGNVYEYDPSNVEVFGTVAADGGVLHDSVDSGGPVKIGAKAVAHGTNPTAVAAGDRTDLYANRHGVPFVIGGHPNIQTLRTNYTAAQTDAALISVSPGTKIAVTKVSVLADKANTVDVQARIGFGATTTPTGAGVILTHPGIAAGSGVIEGTGAALIGIGADGEDLRITSEVPTTGSIDVLVTYYTIES